MAFNRIRGAVAGTPATPQPSPQPQPSQWRGRPSASGFNPYAAGKKHYGAGRGMPNVGKSGYTPGYGQRDAQAAARRDALIRRAGAS